MEHTYGNAAILNFRIRNFVGILVSIFALGLVSVHTLYAQETVSPNSQLINVDFGAGGGRGYSLKAGYAAIGQVANNFWNFYDRDISSAPSNWRYSGALVNLRLANGAATAVGMTVSDAPGAWGDGSSDPMYEFYDYPLDGGNNVVTFTNLPAGQYDVLAYSIDGNYEVTVGGTSYGVKTTYDSPVSSVPVWTEEVQYARFRNVTVGAGQPLVLTVRNGVEGYAILAGVQILGSAPPPPTNQTVVPPLPTLTTINNGANLQLNWPISAGSFQIQSADSPLGPWINVALTIITTGASATATVTTTNQQGYFRLIGQ